MTNHLVGFDQLSIILLAALVSGLSCPVFSQDLESRSPSAEHSQHDFSVSDQDKKLLSSADVSLVSALPDAPMPQDQAQDQPPASGQDSETHLNQFPILSPKLTRSPLTLQEKFVIYAHKSFGPPAVILPALGAGLGMLNPPSKYPKDWKDGAAAFGRNYGYRLADRTSRNTAQFLTGALLHEDPRYLRSTSTNPFVRTVHALAFTVFDKTDSGRTTFAASNFASAAAGGFIGMGILPDGYNDVTHAGQTWQANSCRLGLATFLPNSSPSGDLGPRSSAFPKYFPVGGFQNTTANVELRDLRD